jgi:hypothetical protein
VKIHRKKGEKIETMKIRKKAQKERAENGGEKKINE